VSNADNDVPNFAEGKRICTPAEVILSNPGVFCGKRVYRCIRMKLKKPSHFGTSCLQRTGNSVALLPPGTGTSVAGEPVEGGARNPQLWSVLEEMVTCGIAIHVSGPATEILRNASPIPAPTGVDPSLGGPGWVYLGATGRPETTLNSQYSWQVGLNETRVRIPKLAAGATWRFGPLGITCSIGEESVTCANRQGDGFTVTAESYSAF
jgi:hypothetical protein